MNIAVRQETDSVLGILDSLRMPAFIINRDSVIIMQNAAASGMFGYGPDELAGLDIRQVICGPGDEDNVQASEAPLPALQGAAVTNTEGWTEVFCRKKNGDAFPASFSSVSCSPDGSRIIVVQDRSEQTRLNERASRLEILNELSGIVNSSLSIGTIFRILVSEIKKMVNFDRSSLLLFDERNGTMTIFALDTGLATELKKGVKAPIDKTGAGWALKHNRPWINYDLAREISFPLDAKLLREGIRSTISIPISRDKVLGVFNLDSVEPSRYSEKDFQLLLPAAKHIAIALENALLFEEISREKKEWEKTFDAITDMVWIEDGKQRIIRANATTLRKTGLSFAEISDRYCWEILDRIGLDALEHCLCEETIRNNRPSFRELKGAGGSIFHFWAYPLMDDEGRMYAIVHYVKDVTEHKQLEHQLMQADKLASLGTLVAGIAHEINNPLGIIAGYAEALLDRTRDEKLSGMREFEDFPEYLETIHNEIFRCKRILGSLLDFARPSGGISREIDINELIKEVILLVNHKAKSLRHNIELRLNRDLPKISAEPGSLRQLFMNVIINSMYYTPENGSIIISSSSQDDVIVVAVADSGSGIPESVLPRIFDPFFTTKPVGEGTGLGLAICYRIVSEHGGSIDVGSEQGKGATFYIKLPIRPSHG